MNRPTTLTTILIFSFVFLLSPGSRSRAGADTLSSADTHFRRQSYAAALKEYRAALKSRQVPAERSNEIDYRIAVALGKTHQWDQALAQSLAFVQAHRGSVWEARGLYQLGRLYLAVPPNGYRAGKAVFRGDNVPGIPAGSGDKPRRVTFEEQDKRDAREALEAAHVLYARFHAPETVAEEILLDFDLAHVLYTDARFTAWQTDKKWPDPGDPALTIRPDESYSLDWPPPKKVLTLYAHIRLLGAGTTKWRLDSAKGPIRRPSGPHSTALSLLDEALWLRHYQNAMRGQYAIRYEKDKPVPIPFPYEKRSALDLLRRIVREFPDDPIHDQTHFLLARLLEQQGKFSAAAVEYRRLIADRPKSKWVADCRRALADLAHRSLSFSAPPAYYPGKPVDLQVTSRNIENIRLQLYRVPLEGWISRSNRLNDPTLSLSDPASLVGNPKKPLAGLGVPVAEWTVSATGSAADRAGVLTPLPPLLPSGAPPAERDAHQPRSRSVTLPVREPGAYLLVGSAPGIRAFNLIVKTNLVLVQKTERDRALFFAANAQTGRAVPGTEILAWTSYSEPGKKGESIDRVATVRAVTGPDGTVSIVIPRKANRSNFQVSAFAWRGASVALTAQSGSDDSEDNQGRFKTYGTTDRAVYRPLQTVRFRDVVLERRQNGMHPVVGRPIRVQVFDAKGRRVHAALLTSGEFGSVGGHFDLPPDAPLGEYSVQCSVFKVEAAGTNSGGSQFRVEEYKKPEFQVTVAPDAERVRLGQPTSARVIAKYYFGGPAAGAKVTYRVHRNVYAQTYKFPTPFDFLYDSASQGSYDSSFRNGEVVAQGTSVTDEKGEARISFPTQAEGAQWKDQDISYTVEADVKDSSRRTITGSGSVKATRHDVAVFLNYPHGYAHSGDHVPVEIVSLNASDVPVTVSGVAKVYRQPADPKAKESLIYDRPLSTDSHGRAILDWTATRAGYYRIAFVTRDTAGLEVSGSTNVWVAGAELARGEFLSQGITIAVEQPYYQDGQTAKLLIATEAPDCTILLTREANNQILEKRLIRINGRSAEVSISLQHRDVPNVFLSAVMVRNGQLYEAKQELFVPPVSHLAKLSVRADKEKYQPGEKAKLSLLATDWQGRPLRAELAVSISDAALAYIQKDYAPDIRVFYYGDRRSHSINSSGSTGMQFQGFEEDTQRTPNYPAHQWTLPDGLGLLQAGTDRSRLYVFDEVEPIRLASTAVEGMYISTYHHARLVMKNRSVEMVQDASLLVSRGGKADVNGDLVETDPTVGGIRYRTRISATPSMLTTVTPDAFRMDWKLPRLPPTIRRQFLDTAFWTPAVITDSEGKADIEVTWPDNFTQWRAYAVGNSAAAQVGTAETSVTTRKDLLVRLETPRYFVERDTMLISAIVQNGTAMDQNVLVKLDLDSDNLQIIAEPSADPASKRVSPGNSPEPEGISDPDSKRPQDPRNPRSEISLVVPKDGEKRLDWRVRVLRPGAVLIRASAQASPANGVAVGDATELSVPILIHGVERALATSGVLHGGDGKVSIPVTLPEARKPGTSELVVQVNPSLAAVMLDALPYLNDYPYGCIEQTMSRFLPSILTARVLKEQGYNLEDLRKRAAARRSQAKEGRGALQVEDSPYTYPAGKPGTEPNAINRTDNPVFDSKTLAKMIAAGMTRIRDYQHSDGGWGWWKDDPSDTWMTAYVVYGLIQAREAASLYDAGKLKHAAQFLLKRFREDDDLHRMAFVARVLALEPAYRPAILPIVSGRIFNGRERLSAYSKALLCLALSALGEKSKAAILIGNLENTAQIDDREGTVHWGETGSQWWRWYNNAVEANAAILQAYLAVQPTSRMAPMLVKWLVNHRQGDNWSSTRETALTVYALSDYIRVNKELAPAYTLTLDLGGRVSRTYKVSRANALLFDNRFVVPDSLMQTGAQPLTISKQGTGACYYTVYTRFFSQEEKIPASGNGIYVTRRYFRLLPGTASGTPEPAAIDINRTNPFLAGQYELLAELGTDAESDDSDAGPRYERAALKDGDTVTSGDQIEVELSLEAKNDYEYLAFEDLKPAGFEPVELRSGAKEGQGVCSNFELRDQKVVFFLSNLTQGRRALSYRLRAEAPGAFHALPTNGYAMYAPALRTLSAESTISVKDE